MSQVLVKIALESKEIDAVISNPVRQTSWQGCCVVLTHGAGGDMYHDHLEILTQLLSKTGLLCVRFTMKTPNFKYRVKCFLAVMDYLQNSQKYNVKSCIIGGRSMGARVAAEIASNLESRNKNFIIGLLCISYPLHSSQKTNELRISSISSLKVPTLFVSGTDDVMCRKNTMETTLRRLTCDWLLHWVQGGDHSLQIKGKKPEYSQEIYKEVCNEILLWIQSVFMSER